MSTSLFGKAGHLLTLADHKGLTSDTFDPLIQTGLQSDLFEAAATGMLHGVDREAFRSLIGLGSLEPVIARVLEFVATVEVSATTGTFVARDKFVVDVSENAKVKINGRGSDFINWFLEGDGKVEDAIAASTLRYDKLLARSVDEPIINELGGKAKAETTLTEMFALMAKQPRGENGELLNNDWWNIFYIRDQYGVLRTVDVGWGDGGWLVYAYSVEGVRRWRAGNQVFSRNSVLKSSGTLGLAHA